MKHIITLILFFSKLNATELILPRLTDADFEIIPKALRKLELENQLNIDEEIDTYQEFYLCTVLMHIRYENYANSYAMGLVSLNHIFGLARAFEPYIYAPQSTKPGFTKCNESFLTAVLDFQSTPKLIRRSKHSNSVLKNRPFFPKQRFDQIKRELNHVLDNLKSPEDTLAELQSLLNATQDAITKVQEHTKDLTRKPAAPLSETNVNRTTLKK